MTGGVKVFGGKEGSFFEVVEEALSKVSTKRWCAKLGRPTLIVEVIEYLYSEECQSST